LIAIAGVGVIAMFLLPNPMWGRMIFVLCGGIVLAVGLLLVKAVDDKVEAMDDEVAVIGDEVTEN
ncbi:MAG: hypothetical protein WBM99_13620, partial [Psychromonas sp.]